MKPQDYESFLAWLCNRLRSQNEVSGAGPGQAGREEGGGAETAARALCGARAHAGSDAAKEHVQAAVTALQSLLQVEKFRVDFLATPEAVVRLLDVLRSRQQPNFQKQYQVIFCLWLLSFSQAIAQQLNKCVDCVEAAGPG